MQNAFAAGDIWIAYAWPADWAAMKAKGLKVVYAHPRRERSPGSACSCSARTPRGPSTRMRRRRLELTQTGNWLMNNYALRASNRLARPSCPARNGTPDQQPERPQGAEHTHRQVHPEQARLREGLARGESRRVGGLNGTALARRPDDAEPPRAAARLARRLLPHPDRHRRRVLGRRALSLDLPGAHEVTFEAWRDFFDGSQDLRLFSKSVKMSLLVSVIVVALAYPLAYYLALSGTKRKYVLLLLLIALFPRATSCACSPGR